MPMRPRSGSATVLRHMKSWSSSCVRRLLERGDLAALRVDAVEHALDRAVLAGRVHALEDQQQRPAVLRVELFLKIVEPLAVGLEDLLALVLVEAALLGGLVRFEMEFARAVDSGTARRSGSSSAGERRALSISCS